MKIKKLLLSFLVMTIATISFCSTTTKTNQTKVAKKNSVTFNGKVYEEAYVLNNPQEVSLIEFLPKGQDLDTYKQMVAVWTYNKYKGGKGLQEYVENYLQNLSSGRLGAKAEDIQIFENKDGSEVIVTFYIHIDGLTEYDVFRYVVKNGVVVGYQYVERNYASFNDKSTKEWMKKIDKEGATRAITKMNY